MKTFSWILLSFFTFFKLQAQDVQVTLVDPCVTIEKKSTIIINDHTAATTNTRQAATESNTVYFTLTSSFNTSAGVYNASGNLIRTLWNGVRYDAGNYKALWSGIMDDGTLAPPGTYQVKVLTNNVQYTWEGVIGNSSTDFTGDYILKGNEMEDLCFVGTKAFGALGYSEHGSVQKMFLTTDVHKFASERYGETTQTSLHVCTDGNILYWAGGNYYNSDSWVYGAYPADNASPYAAMVPFSAGVAESFSDASGSATYNNAISVAKGNGNAFISSICVQKTGNLLFIARGGINQLQILNKTTGEVYLNTTAYTNPTSVACDDNGHLFIVYNSALHKFNIVSNTQITDTGISFTGLVSPGYMDTSPDYYTIAVADNATNQVKFYGSSGGAILNTLGTGVGYATSPYADNYKFYSINFVKYQPDGSLWVGDKENYRYMHYNTDRTYKEQMAWVGESRSTSVDPNTPTRVFTGFVEFERDYSKVLDNGTNGSWKLKANWAANIPNFDVYTRFKQVVTLSNGKTYSVVRHTNNSNEVYELSASGARATGVYINGPIGRDGTIFYSDNINNDYMVAKRQLLTGFTNNSPNWAPPTVFATSPHATYYTPANYYFQDNTNGLTSDANKYVFFNNSGPPQNGSPDAILGWHLGSVKIGESSYEWKASKSTFTNYAGAYPTNGDYDIGNGWPLQHSLTHAMVYGHDIFWNANGEFWKQGEINIWNHFNDDGLLIGQFGIAQPNYPAAAAKMAGNAFGTAMAKVGDDYYIYHCDESVHAGVHSWHVAGLNTVSEQGLPIAVAAAVTVAPDPTSLMGGVPFRSNFTGGNGWTVDQPTSGLTMPTGLFQYQQNNIDLNISGSSIQVVKRTLNSTVSLNSWTLSGGMIMIGSEPTIGSDNYNYLEVVDIAGKIIARFQAYADTRNDYHVCLLINSSTKVSEGDINLYNSGLRVSYNDFAFNYVNGILTFKLANYNPVAIGSTFDNGANKAAPAYLRISQGSPGNQNHALDLYKLKFTGM